MQTKVQVSDASIETAGLPTDYKEAITEFIWNSFDAKATTVKINFDNTDPIGHLLYFSISDNGTGINFHNLKNTFGAFLDSEKKRGGYQRTSYVHGKKGKGRFSFEAFSAQATWQTIFNDGEYQSFEIVINASDKDLYNPSEVKVIKEVQTGTTIIFDKIHTITCDELNSEEFKSHLRAEFGWFLHLNKNKDFQIYINDRRIDYEKIIADSEVVEYKYIDSKENEQSFCVNYIRWATKIGDKFYNYYLNTGKVEQAKKLTSFNNKADEFFHSIFVESNYFDNFSMVEDTSTLSILGKNQTDKTFVELNKDLYKLLSKKRKVFIRDNSDRLISRFEQQGVMPQFKDNKYDQARKKDFEEVVKEIYATEPKIFSGLGKEQQQTFLGMLNLVLDTDERENILKIIDEIVKLDSEGRQSLADVLKKTSLSKIIRTMKMVEQRYEKVEMLKTLVYDLKKFTTERDHIQTIVEDNYWLFGEQYNLVSADIPFQNALSEYLYLVDGNTEKEKYKMDHPEKNRRPDIFICRKRSLPDHRDDTSEIEENVIVELKTPSIFLGKKEYRQVMDYLDIVLAEAKFNSQTRKWKFILLSNSVDSTIQELYKAWDLKGKLYLVHAVEKYEIYVMTWDDIFRNFEIRHKYILDKLQFDKVAIQEELRAQGITLSRESADSLTEQILTTK